MLAKVFAAANIGFDGQLVEVECDMSSGLPGITIVGLPNKAIDEAKERLRSALKNTKLKLPPKRITVNLAPADLPKDGTAYDTAMAVAILAASEQIRPKKSGKNMFVGELALDGAIRPVPGVLSYVETAKRHQFDQVFIPQACTDEARLIKGITVYPINHLNDIYRHFVGDTQLSPLKPRDRLPKIDPTVDSPDFSDIYGQSSAKRALEIAAAGGHNVLLTGPPGAGKTMLAKSIVSILPPPNLDEAIAITKMHSLSGQHGYRTVAKRPFRHPHHTTSDIAIIGGGQTAKPGEISLAHHGVLFLDELPEFKRSVLEALRQPLEDGDVTITRARHSANYPADFMLVATQNPCPCGYLEDELHECSCSMAAIQRYRKKISGPLLDRIDLVIPVQGVKHDKLLRRSSGESSRSIAARVDLARQRQYRRLAGRLNAGMTNKEIKRFCTLDQSTQAFLSQAMERLNLSARGYMRVLKTARTIADLENADIITTNHLSESLQYRDFNTDQHY